MNKLIVAAKDGLRFGLLIGLGAGLLDTLLRGFHKTEILSDLVYCPLGGLLGSLSYRWLSAHRASRKSRQPPQGTSGEGI